MVKYIFCLRWLTIIYLTLFLSCSGFGFLEQVSAKNKDDKSNEGLPVRRIGGGTRRECLQAQTASPEKTPQTCSPLIALMPENLVITSTESPTLLFYIPAINNPQKIKVEFVLRDHQDQLVYETPLNISGQGGIVSLKIPATETFKGLKAEQNYHWYLSIIYNSFDRAHDDVVEGWLRYTPLEPAIISQLAQATLLEQVHLYKQYNLWHEALYTLAQLKQNNPQDVVIAQLWTEILQSLNLGIIASEPLINGMTDAQFHTFLKF